MYQVEGAGSARVLCWACDGDIEILKGPNSAVMEECSKNPIRALVGAEDVSRVIKKDLGKRPLLALAAIDELGTALVPEKLAIITIAGKHARSNDLGHCNFGC